MKNFLLIGLTVICALFTFGQSYALLAGDNLFSHQDDHLMPKDPSQNIPPRPRTEAAIEAEKFFLQTFNNGEYEKIDSVLIALVGAYLTDPEDSITAGYIGSAHLWRLTEQSRLNVILPTITDSIPLARKYLQRSVDLYPNAVWLGQLGAVMMAEGGIDINNQLIKQGNRILMQSVKDWPEFNLFTPSYIFSRELPSNDKKYLESVEMLWKNYEICVNHKIDRNNPDYTPFLGLYTDQGRKRVCFNIDIAPHNLEGFFMHFGDALVKAGDWETAQKIYMNSQVQPSYSEWKYKEQLEDRITNAELNVSRFNASPDGSTGEYRPVMSASPYACVACHQK